MTDDKSLRQRFTAWLHNRARITDGGVDPDEVEFTTDSPPQFERVKYPSAPTGDAFPDDACPVGIATTAGFLPHHETPERVALMSIRALADTHGYDEILDAAIGRDIGPTTEPREKNVHERAAEEVAEDLEAHDDAVEELIEDGGLPSGDEMAGMVIEDAHGVVTATRDTHGDAVENQQHIADGWTWYLRGKGVLADGERITGGDVGRMMPLVKMSRTAVGTYDVDHDRDVCGYAGIAAACEVADGNADLEDLTGEADNR